MFKRSARYFTLALSLVVLSSSAMIAAAQRPDPCIDPSTGCVVGGTDPQPTGSAVTTTNVVGGTDPQPTGSAVTDGGSNELTGVVPFFYGLA